VGGGRGSGVGVRTGVVECGYQRIKDEVYGVMHVSFV
jgi:hypothetical protein